MGIPTVLLYNLDSEKGRRIKLLCLPLRIRARNVSPEEYGLSLEDLLNGGAPAEEAPPAFAEEMLVMSGLGQNQMDQLLNGFRRKKIPTVALKAVVTPTNLRWDSCRLRDELLAEHEAMQKGKPLH